MRKRVCKLPHVGALDGHQLALDHDVQPRVLVGLEPGFGQQALDARHGAAHTGVSVDQRFPKGQTRRWCGAFATGRHRGGGPAQVGHHVLHLAFADLNGAGNVGQVDAQKQVQDAQPLGLGHFSHRYQVHQCRQRPFAGAHHAEHVVEADDVQKQPVVQFGPEHAAQGCVVRAVQQVVVTDGGVALSLDDFADVVVQRRHGQVAFGGLRRPPPVLHLG